NLPLTDARLRVSNDSLLAAMTNLGNVYLNDVEDYESAIETLEKIRTRFPSDPNMDEILFNLYYSYKKTGNEAKMEEIRRLLQSTSPSSRFTAIIATGKDPVADKSRKLETTKTYEGIYNLFIEGKFDEAETAKKRADSIYRTNYWQPQLLYIEAVYFMRQRNDSLAKNNLQTIISQNGESPITIRAQNMLQVLNRRQQIETELTNLKIEKPAEDSTISQPVVQAPAPRRDTIAIAPPPKNNVVITPKQPVDTSARKPVVQPKAASVFTFDAGVKHYGVIILDKVDPLFANEVKNAFGRFNRDYYYNQTFDISMREFDADRKMVLVGGFNNAQEAVDYMLKAKSLAANEILPWLTKEKYSFSIISQKNLDILMENKDLARYRQFLDQNLPVKF
ncbi:MAG: tetratricopeptide repeat protein, partial [Flavisolibacter sp.]